MSYPEFDDAAFEEVAQADEASAAAFFKPPNRSCGNSAFFPPGRWWIADGFREQFGLQQKPRIPTHPGTCLVLMACPRTSRWFGNCVVFPLRWVRREARNRHVLPPKLEQLAELVCHDLGTDHWALIPHDEVKEFSGMDFRGFRLAGWDSAYATLLAGLYTAIHGLSNQPMVWATAKRHEKRGIDQVANVPAKLAAAWSMTEPNLRDRFRFFYCSDEAVPHSEAPRDVIHRLPSEGKASAAAALSQYLSALMVPPAAETSFQSHEAYYLKAHPELAEQHLLQVMLKRFAAERREILNQKLNRRGLSMEIDCLITVLGPIVANTATGLALVSKPGLQVWLIVDGEEFRNPKSKINQGYSTLHQLFPDCRFHVECMSMHSVDFELDQRVQEAARFEALFSAVEKECPSARTAIDITPGFKFQTVHLVTHARPDTWMMYFRHAVDPETRRVRHTTANYDVWQKV